MAATAVPIPDRARLEELDEQLERLIRRLRKRVESGAPLHVQRFRRTARRAAIGLSATLPPDLDPEALAEIRRLILEGIAVLEEGDGARPLDLADDFLVRAEAIRQYVRDALDEHLDVDEGNAGAVANRLVEWLPRVSQQEIARLAGISPRQFQRWRSGGGPAPRRLQLVARLVALLRRAWTPEGVVAWFDRPRPELGGKRPVEVLDDPSLERSLVVAVRQGRAQGG